MTRETSTHSSAEPESAVIGAGTKDDLPAIVDILKLCDRELKRHPDHPAHQRHRTAELVRALLPDRSTPAPCRKARESRPRLRRQPALPGPRRLPGDR